MSAVGEGSLKRSSTAAALIFRRLPEAASTCSDVSLSARIVPALNWPSSSKKTCMGRKGRCGPGSVGFGADYTGRGGRGLRHLRADAARPAEHRALHAAGTCGIVARSTPGSAVMAMEYRRLGASGLEVSTLCLGTMMFGDRTDAAASRRIVDSAFDAGVNFIDTADVYVKGVSESIVGAAITANRRHWILATKVRQRDDGETARRRTLASLGACGLRRQPAAPRDRLYRHLLPAPRRSRHAARRNGRRARRPDPRRQDPLFRHLELPRLADRRSRRRMRGAGRAAAGRLPAVLQPAQPQPEVEILPACDYYGIGVAPYSPDRARRADRQVRARRRRTRGLARRAQGRADDGDRVSRGIVRDRAEAEGARGEDRTHARCNSRSRGSGPTRS